MGVSLANAPPISSDVLILAEGRGVTTAGASVQNLADVTIPTALGDGQIVVIELFFDQASGVGTNTKFGVSNVNNNYTGEAWTYQNAVQSGCIRLSLRPSTSQLNAAQCDAMVQATSAVSVAFEQDTFDFSAAEHIYINCTGVAACTYAVRWIVYLMSINAKH